MLTAMHQRGLSLIELMIALTLGSLLIFGVLSVFAASNLTYRNNEALARVQENGRFAIDLLASELRQAGYTGSCTTTVNNLLDETHAAYRAERFDFDHPVRGWDDDGGSTLTNYVANTDTLLVLHAAQSSGLRASGNTAANSGTIDLTSQNGLSAGALLLVADSEGCDLFQNRSAQNAPALDRSAAVGTRGPGNKNPGANNFSHDYTSLMELQSVRSAIYFVGVGAGGAPALRRMRFDLGTPAVSEEVIEGIADLRICYGIDSNDDRETDSYVRASSVSNWGEVVSVRVTLIAIAPESGRVDQAQTVTIMDCDGLTEIAIPIAQRRLGGAFTATVALRNRLP